jgi:pimeloyl-ACP methyl ester carboxylesterase
VRCLVVRAGEHAVYTRIFQGPRAGARLPVILVPGFLVSGRYMLPAARALSRHLDVIIPDPPGHGHSSKPPAALTVPQYADWLAQWAEVLGIHRAVYVGHSFGGQLVSALAVTRPDLVSAAVLAGPTVDPALHSLPQLAARLALDFLHERPSLVATELYDFWDMGVKYFLGELRSMLDDHIEDRLPTLQQPVLFVRGARDPIAPAGWVHKAAQLTPDATYREIPNAPHAANYSVPDGFVNGVLPFLLEHTST